MERGGYNLGRNPRPGRKSRKELNDPNQSSPDELARRYDAAYNYNRGNWDNPNSAPSWNPPTWEPDDEWGSPRPYKGVGPRAHSRADANIQRDICKRMAAHGRLDASSIEVTVNNHEVTLSGNVIDRQGKRLAEDIAESVFGADDIHNHLRVQKQGQMQGQSQGRMTSGQMTGSRANLSEGEEVVGTMGHKLGTVKEIHKNDFVLNRPMKPDVHVPFSAIKGTSGNQIKLDVTADQVDKQGWAHL